MAHRGKPAITPSEGLALTQRGRPAFLFFLSCSFFHEMTDGSFWKLTSLIGEDTGSNGMGFYKLQVVVCETP